MSQTEPSRHGVASQLNLIQLKKTTFTLPLDLYRQLKIEAAKRGEEMSSIVTDALRKHLTETEHEQ